MPELTVRPAGADDIDAVVGINLAARGDAERRSVMPPGIHPDHEVRDWLASKLGTDELWLAEVAGDPVGYARLTDTWLDDLYVDPGHARQGIGTVLLEVAKSRRPDGFCLWVFEVNHPARAFYARHGLVELERTDGSGNEEKAPDIRMAWPGHDPLAFFRDLIDEVDEQLADLLARRAALTRAVQAHKADPTRDPDRERSIAATMARRAPALGEERLARIVHAIITESLDAASEG
jgi:chorismate mutase/GNAT superfamily N-acetyltransferase